MSPAPYVRIADPAVAGAVPTLRRAEVEVALALPTPNLREHPMGRAGREKRQRKATRNALELMARRVRLPAVVTLTRISTRLADTDRAALSLSAVRDETARWLCGVPFEEPKLVKGELKMVTPRAPDGPNDPITWQYAQQRSTQKGFQGVRILIESRGP